MSQYTPGPWEVEGPNSTQLRVRAHLRFNVAKIRRLDSLSETEANARLIAAAPELLSILKEIVDFIDGEGPASMEWKAITERCAAARAAIAKVESKP